MRVELRLGEMKEETKRSEAHLKEMIPNDGWNPNEYDTLEIMDPETGKESDRITKFGTY